MNKSYVVAHFFLPTTQASPVITACIWIYIFCAVLAKVAGVKMLLFTSPVGQIVTVRGLVVTYAYKIRFDTINFKSDQLKYYIFSVLIFFLFWHSMFIYLSI